MGGVRLGGGGRGIRRINSSRTRKNYIFERRIGGDGVSADAALTASALTAATENNRQKKVLSSAGWGGTVPERMGEEDPSYYVGGRRGGYRYG